MNFFLNTLILFSLSILLCFDVYSQSSGDYQTKGNEYYEKGDYVNAILALEKAKSIIEKESRENSIEYGEVLFLIASVKFRLDDVEDFKTKLAAAEKIFLSKPDITLNQQYEVLKIKIQYFFSIGDYLGVDQLAEYALELTKRANAATDQSYYALLTRLGIAKFNVGKIIEGENFLLEVIAYKKRQSVGSEQNGLAETIALLAGLLDQNNQIKRAEDFYIESFKISGKNNEFKGNKYLSNISEFSTFYNNHGEYVKAINLYHEAISVVKKQVGIENHEYVYWTHKLGSTYLILYRLDSAQFYIEETLSVKERLNGIDASYAYTLLTYGNYFMRKGNNQEAEKTILKGLSIFRLDSNDFNKAALEYGLGLLAKIHEEKGEIDKAETERLEAYTIISTTFPKTNKRVLNSLESLAIFYANMGKFQPSDSIYKVVLNTYGSSFVIDSISIAATLSQYSGILKSFGKYDEAQEALTKAILITEKLEGQLSENYLYYSLQLSLLYLASDKRKFDSLVTSLKLQYQNKQYSHIQSTGLLNLLLLQFAEHSSDIGEYSSAEEYYETAVKLSSRSNYDYGFAIMQLGGFYREIGSFQKAVQKYIQAINLLKQQGADFTNASQLLALQYIEEKKFSDALLLYKDCIEFYKSRNLESKSLALTYIRIAELEGIMNQHTQAENDFKFGIALLEKNGYSKTREYFESIQSFAQFSFEIEKNERADSLYKKLLDLYKNDEHNIGYARTLFNSANLQADRKKYILADSLYLRALNYLEMYFGEQNVQLMSYYGSVAWFYAHVYPQKASVYFDKVYATLKKDILRQFEYLSGDEKSSYVSNIIKSMYGDLSSLFRNELFWPKYSFYIYNSILLFKKLILNNTISVQSEIRKSNDADVKALWEKYLSAKMTVSHAYMKSNINKGLIESEEQSLERIEKKIVKKIPALNSLKKAFEVQYRNVQFSMKENEASIEFITFPYYQKAWSDSTLYVALILRPGYSEPKFVYLFEEQQLLTVLKKQPGILDQLYLNKLYQFADSPNAFYNLIWKPLDSLLQGVTTVYVAPSGLLHKIALGAIQDNEGKSIASKYGIQILGTTGDIINKTEDYIDRKSVNEAIVFGGINYEVASSKPLDFISNVNNKVYAFVPADSTRGGTGKWNYLGGTLNEGQAITREFKTQNITTSFYSDSTATETLFKTRSFKENSIIHIATHGYFFPDIVRKTKNGLQLIGEQKQPAFKASENPLLRSGLIFAGANHSWTNPDYVSTATDDGILTAYEISNLDLSNVKLVVLSACETGLGDIKGSEGVFGLQRSFKLAGVKNIIMSLWKVPDEKTSELMQLFYQNCFAGKSIRQAFTAAQTIMSEKYPSAPYYWAGFTLLQ